MFELVGPIHISRDPGTIPRPAVSLQRCCVSDTWTSHYLGLFTPLKGKHTDEVAKSKQSTVSTKTKKFKEIQFQKLLRLPDGCHPDFDNGHLCSVNNHDLLPEMSTPSADLHLLPETGVENMRTPKSSFHAELKCELSKLNTVLKLPDNVLFLANQSLEYLLNNHLVVREPRSILHAFNIALCWRAASFLKYT